MGQAQQGKRGVGEPIRGGSEVYVASFPKLFYLVELKTERKDK